MCDLERLRLVAPYIDPQLVFSMLCFAENLRVDVKAAMIQLLVKHTKMYDVAEDIGAVIPENLKRQLMDEHKSLKELCAPLLKEYFLESDDKPRLCIKADAEEQRKNGQLSIEVPRRFGVASKMVQALVDLAYLYHSIGWSAECSHLLRFFTSLPGVSAEQEASTAWGLLVSDILAGNWVDAAREVVALEKLTRNNMDGICFLHTLLFVAYRGRRPTLLLDVVFGPESYEAYQNIIETRGSHLLRYVLAAHVVNREKRIARQRLCEMIIRAQKSSPDPFTTLAVALWVSHDITAAMKIVQDIPSMVDGDYFLSAFKSELVNGALKLVFEGYLRSHAEVDMKFVAKQTNQTVEEAEMWLADLIRVAKIQAKIDSVAQTVMVTPPRNDVYTRLLNKLEGVHRQALV